MKQIKVCIGENAANEWLEEYRDYHLLELKFYPSSDSDPAKFTTVIVFEQDVDEEESSEDDS